MERDPKTEKKSKSLKKKVLRAATAVTAAASVLAGTLFTKPEELVSPEATRPEPAIVYTIEQEKPAGTQQEQAAPEEEKRSLFERIRQSVRQAILKLPLWVRAVFILPLCAVGWGLTALANALWSAVLSPVVSFCGKWLIAAGILFAVVAIGLKLLFPDMKAKELFNKPNLIGLGAACLVMAVANPLSELLWPDDRWVGPVIVAGACLCYIAFLAIPIAVRHRKKAAVKAAA